MTGSLILLEVLCCLLQDPPLVNDTSNVDVNQFKGITRGGEKYLIENRKGRDSIKDPPKNPTTYMILVVIAE